MENINQRKEVVYADEKDGINVIQDNVNNRYVVDLPYSYEVYWGFNGKSKGVPVANRLESTVRDRVFFEVPFENLQSNNQIRDFNMRVNEARRVNSEMVREKDDFQEVISFDQARDGKQVAFIYANPAKGYFLGEVLKTGKYMVAMAAGENDDKIFVRVLYSNRFLNGKDDYDNREDKVKDMFPVGEKKYITFNDQGRVNVKDYKPKPKVVQKPVIKDYEEKVQDYEKQGMSRSDAQGVVDAEELQAERARKNPKSNDQKKEVAEQIANELSKEVANSKPQREQNKRNAQTMKK